MYIHRQDSTRTIKEAMRTHSLAWNSILCNNSMPENNFNRTPVTPQIRVGYGFPIAGKYPAIPKLSLLWFFLTISLFQKHGRRLLRIWVTTYEELTLLEVTVTTYWTRGRARTRMKHATWRVPYIKLTFIKLTFGGGHVRRHSEGRSVILFSFFEVKNVINQMLGF